MPTTVYRYGAPARVARDLPTIVIAQMLLAHEFRTHLVEVHHEFEQAVEDIWAAQPAVASVARAEEDAVMALAAVETRTKDARQSTRTTKAGSENIEQLAAARRELAIARTAHKKARGSAYPFVKLAIDSAKRHEWAQQKAAYADFVQTRGLYWATFNDVLAHHKTAVKRVTLMRKQGRAAHLHGRRWDGTGTITVQLQRGCGDRPRTPELLASGSGKWRNVARIAPWVDPNEFTAMTRSEQRCTGHGVLTMRVGGGSAVIPIQIHRMLPRDADVTLVRLTRTRIGSGFRLFVTVTAKMPDVARRGCGPAVAVHLGWRSRPDGTVRVATLVASELLEVRDTIADVIRVCGDGTWAEIILPPAIRTAAENDAALRSSRDRAREAIRARLATWLTEHGSVDLPADRDTGAIRAVTSRDAAAWRSAARFAKLALTWRDEPPAGGVDIAAALEAWRKQDKLMWDRQSHSRAQHIAHRNELWKRAAAWITEHFSHIVIDDIPVAVLAAAPRPDAEEIPQARAARATRTLASPATLRALITAAADQRGITVTSIPTATTRGTTVHHACGGQNPRDERYAKDVVVTCDHCGRSYDQDRNAALTALAARGLVPTRIQSPAGITDSKP